MIADTLLNTGDQPFASGALTDIYEGSLNGSKVCVQKARIYLTRDPREVRKVCYIFRSPPSYHFPTFLQRFLKVAVTWRHLRHKNVVPFLGATLDPPQLVSAWMPGRDLTEYLAANPEKNRLDLVSFFPSVSAEVLTLFLSCTISLKAWNTSTPTP